MRAAAQDTEWDAVWAEYDRQAGMSVAAPAADRRGRRWPLRLALLALLLLPLSISGPVRQRLMPSASGREAAPASLSPVEADLPPLSAAIARLAAESVPAACWALDLWPQGGGCPLRTP